jgi:hypothetical protein
MASKSALTVVRDRRQRFIDVPVYAEPKRRPTLDLSMEVALNGQVSTPRRLLLRHEREMLIWMKPGPDGKLVPR